MIRRYRHGFFGRRKKWTNPYWPQEVKKWVEGRDWFLVDQQACRRPTGLSDLSDTVDHWCFSIQPSILIRLNACFSSSRCMVSDAVTFSLPSQNK